MLLQEEEGEAVKEPAVALFAYQYVLSLLFLR